MRTVRFFGLYVVMLSLLILSPVKMVYAEMARYNVDPDHSTVGFSVTHMTVSKTTGRFMDFTGFIEMDTDSMTVKAIEANIKTESVNTNHKKRDEHLKTEDFFDVKKYPAMTLVGAVNTFGSLINERYCLSNKNSHFILYLDS